MKNTALMALFILGGTLAFSADPVPYDKAAAKDIMHANIAAIDTVNKAMAAQDWEAVASGFMQFAQNAQKARQFAPPKGDAKEWARIWDDFLFAAYRGVGAAGDKDAVKAKAALDQIIGERNAGHPQFKG